MLMNEHSRFPFFEIFLCCKFFDPTSNPTVNLKKINEQKNAKSQEHRNNMLAEGLKIILFFSHLLLNIEHREKYTEKITRKS